MACRSTASMIPTRGDLYWTPQNRNLYWTYYPLKSKK